MVLATALEIIDRDGADGLSMRRLARALDRDPMILYRHAPNKAALLDGVAETVLAQLEVDPADPDGRASSAPSPATTARWRWPTRTSCRCWLPGPWPHRSRCGPRAPCARLKMSSPCSPGPASAAPTRHIYRALFGFLHGHVLNELQELVDNPDETDDLLRLGLHRPPIGEFPLLRSLAPVLAAYDGAAELERGLDILLTGLAATLPPPDRARPSSRVVHPPTFTARTPRACARPGPPRSPPRTYLLRSAVGEHDLPKL